MDRREQVEFEANVWRKHSELLKMDQDTYMENRFKEYIFRSRRTSIETEQN